MSCKATLTDLVEALTQSMSVVETAKTALHIELSQIIREARKQLNLSQKELAEKMGVKQSLVSRWESGECNYTIDTLVEIANALKLSVQCPLTFDEVSLFSLFLCVRKVFIPLFLRKPSSQTRSVLISRKWHREGSHRECQ